MNDRQTMLDLLNEHRLANDLGEIEWAGTDQELEAELLHVEGLAQLGQNPFESN
jgi:hypothetical protein